MTASLFLTGSETVPRKRQWNGYGLSFWSCKCGARRKVTGFLIRGGERIERVYATPCKRCGNTDDPVGWPSDPWLNIEQEAW